MPASASLVGLQRADGGWSQLTTLPSDAHATGQGIVALSENGADKASQSAIDRGLEYLRKAQAADGSWHVLSVIPLQPFFESGFPYGRDQFISAAATGWATTAPARSSP